MALYITDDCINCDACETECPNKAIYAGGEMWTMAEGTELTDDVTLKNGSSVGAFDEQEAISNDFFYIVADKCTECVGFHDEPQCAAVCPVDCCIPDPNNAESEDELSGKQSFLHG